MAKASETFEATVLPLMDAVYRAALALCGHTHEAEDLAQTVAMKALAAFGSFQAGTNCKAWLMRILHNTWVDSVRRRVSAGTVVDFDDVAHAIAATEEETVYHQGTKTQEEKKQDGPAERLGPEVLESFSDGEIIAALQALPDDQRVALVLVDVEGLSGQEAAEVMGVAVGTVKSRCGRGRETLRQRLADHARDLGYPRRKP